MALNNDIIPGRLLITGMPPSVRVSSNLFAQEHTHNDCKQSDPTRRTNDYINETAFCHPLRSLDFPGRGRRLWKRRAKEVSTAGIAPQYQKKIFGLFQRLHSTETYPGTGIGLALVRRGIERMGGRVGLESGAGAGSKFWFELKNAAAV